MAPRVGPVHGPQPRPKTTPSTGAPASPAAGCQPGFELALRADAEEDQGHRDDDDAADADEQHSGTRAARAPRPSGADTEHEDDREAEDEQQRAEDDPAAPALRQRRVTEAGDVAEEARHEGQHARGGERDDPGHDRDGQAAGSAPEATVEGSLTWAGERR